MSTSLYVMPAVQVANPFAGQDPTAPATITVPEYFDSFLKGQTFVGFYFNGGVSVLVACEQNDGLDSAAHVLIIDPNDLDALASNDDLDTIASLAGTAPTLGSTNQSASKASLSGEVGSTDSATYRQALQQLNNGSPIVLNAGTGLQV
jgi:hypothetical protein